MSENSVSKFKVGDRVRRITKSDWPRDYGEVGKEYTVLDFEGAGIVVLAGKGGAYKHAFELVHAWTPKLGDRVRLVKDGFSTTGAAGKSATIIAWDDGEFLKRGKYLLDIDAPVDYKTLSMMKNLTQATIDCFEPLPALRIEAGRYYRTRDGRKVGPMKRWSDAEHGWEQSGGSAAFDSGGDIWRDDGTSNYGIPPLIALWEEPVAVSAATPLVAATVDAINDEYGPVVASAGSGAKFKVGDRVRVSDDIYILNADQRTGVIAGASVFSRGDFVVEIDNYGGSLSFFESELSLLAPPTSAIVALIEDGQPKPASRPYVHATTEAAQAEAQRMANVHKGQAFGVYALTGEPVKVDPPVYAYEWQRLAAEGKKIAAIKELRTISGMSLWSAKNAVEYYERNDLPPWTVRRAA